MTANLGIVRPSMVTDSTNMKCGRTLVLPKKRQRPHPVASRLAHEQELPAPRLATKADESQEREGLGLAQSAPLSAFSRIAVRLQRARFLPAQFEPKLH